MLEGGVFALCAKEDIKNTDGDVLVKADTIMEQKATDKDGKIFFTADLPVGGSFYVKEVKAPAGFVTTEEVKELLSSMLERMCRKLLLSTPLKMRQLSLKSQNLTLPQEKSYRVQNWK